MKRDGYFRNFILLTLGIFAFASPCAHAADTQVPSQDQLQPREAVPAAPAGQAPATKEELKDTLNAAEEQKKQQQQQAAPNPYADLPEEVIQEAQHFYSECEAQFSMTQYYDCKCLASKYLDTRIQLGPDAYSGTIVQTIQSQCIDATQAAGIQYERCLQNAPMMPANIPIEEYCTCYANTYGKLFEGSGVSPSSSTFVSLQTQAHLACRNPDRAKKLFPQNNAILQDKSK